MVSRKNTLPEELAELIAENAHSTVIANFVPSTRTEKSYQSEADLEKDFIKRLKNQGYEYVTIRGANELENNLRKQLELLNEYNFTDNEWRDFFQKNIANQTDGIAEKTRTIQEDHQKVLMRDNGETKNIFLIDKKNIHRNFLQVINQYTSKNNNRSHRYDVTILVNGFPLVHIELKRRGVPIREAFNQIDRYQRESFWADSKLFEYIQIFVISNGTHTKYYSNTTRFSAIKEQNNQKTKGKKTSNSFEFTSWWADANNRRIMDLMDFARTFFARHTILNVLTKYCVFTADRMLLVMRPYQIVATERIINQIVIATNYKKYGTIEGGGYIWHTTGSGKTLTSFKTSILASELDFVEKVLFVVDRKDLDYQTMKEYDKFQKGAANGNASTAKLTEQLGDKKAKIIITTIQKLSRFIKKNPYHPIFDQHTVLIFDECHRSQFGEMHQAITKKFKKYHLFGFTGTPIFSKNANSSSHPHFSTTQQVFGKKLHTYTIVDAIADENVLPFKVSYVSTMRAQENIEDKKVQKIDTEKVLMDKRRIKNIVSYILEHFDQKTLRNTHYTIKERRLKGFNSIFAVASIDLLKAYYEEFQQQMKKLVPDQRLKIATIFSYAANEDFDEMIDDENLENPSELPPSSRDFLEKAIVDYNEMFDTAYDTSPEKFQNYYKDLAQRVKDREVDILLVVNMFLTGFDATTLNTLWVDKNLQSHGLIQAFSRTNRILNGVKRFGNIISFRDLEEKTNEALLLFGNKEAKEVVIIKSFDEYYFGYFDEEKNTKIEGYYELAKKLQKDFPIGQDIISEEKKRDFIDLYGKFLRRRNILQVFDEFREKDLLSNRDLQDYHGMYIDLHTEFKKEKSEQEIVNDDIVFEMELIRQVEVNIDYILNIIRKYQENPEKNPKALADVYRAIDSSVELRNKKDLIEEFISVLNPHDDLNVQWHQFIEKKRDEELDQIIAEENLAPEETRIFVQKAFEVGAIKEVGMDILKILPRCSAFDPNNNRETKKQTVIGRLWNFFERFFDISGKNF